MIPLMLALTILPVAAWPALAQEETEATLRAQPVIVTAPGPQRLAGELIGNATALERGELVERLAGSLADTIDAEPGVSSTFFGAGASRPVLRGLGAERVMVLTNGIGVIDASSASPDHQVAGDAIDAERIEILRGPAALAYGGAAIGGVVNLIDGLIVETLPEDAASGEALAAYDSVSDGSELAGRVSLSGGPLVFTLSGSQRDFSDFDIPGFAESGYAAHDEHEEEEDHEHDHEPVEGTLENAFLESDTLAGGLTFVGDRGFIGIAVRRQKAIYGLPGHEHHEHDGEEEEEAGAHEAEEGEEMPFIDLAQTRYDLRAGYAFDHPVLQRIEVNAALADYSHTEFEAAGVPGTVYDTSGFEGRIEIDHALAGFEGALGVQVLDKDFGAFGDESFIQPTTTTSWGVFLYETREWDSGYGVEGGLRLERAELSSITGAAADFTLTSASFGAHRHFDNGWFLGAQLSHTERAPNESELFADGAHLATAQYEIGNPGLDAEKGLNLETTARWRGQQVSGGVSLFHTRFDGFIALAPTGGEADGLPVFAFVQRDARFTGGEVYGEAALPQGWLGADWRIRAGLDMVRGEFAGGEDVPLLPPITLNLDTRARWGRLELGADMTHANAQRAPGAGYGPTEAYTLLGARASFDLGEPERGEPGAVLFIEARNLTDAEARLSTSVLRDSVPLPGRNIRAGLRATF